MVEERKRETKSLSIKCCTAEFKTHISAEPAVALYHPGGYDA
jgi:hypothetical protein